MLHWLCRHWAVSNSFSHGWSFPRHHGYSSLLPHAMSQEALRYFPGAVRSIAPFQYIWASFNLASEIRPIIKPPSWGSRLSALLLVHGGWQAVVGFKQTTKVKSSQPCSAALRVSCRHTPKKDTKHTMKTLKGMAWKQGEVWKQGDGYLSRHIQLPGSSNVCWGSTLLPHYCRYLFVSTHF